MLSLVKLRPFCRKRSAGACTSPCFLMDCKNTIKSQDPTDRSGTRQLICQLVQIPGGFALRSLQLGPSNHAWMYMHGKMMKNAFPGSMQVGMMIRRTMVPTFPYGFPWVRANHDLSMVCLWFVYGLSMVCQWFVNGVVSRPTLIVRLKPCGCHSVAVFGDIWGHWHRK